jgi:hypothetical protein
MILTGIFPCKRPSSIDRVNAQAFLLAALYKNGYPISRPVCPGHGLFLKEPMIKRYLRRLFISNKEFILGEVSEVKGLMHLLMKHRHLGEHWTREEKREILSHLKKISRSVPALLVFFLPFGSLLLPVLVEAIDSRRADYRDNP